MFIADVFIVVKLWKHPICPTTDEWPEKKIYIHTHTHTHTHNGVLFRHSKE
jgi:hypothetical protein